MMALSPFDFINAVSHTKKDLIAEDPSNLKEYNPWLTNKGLSYFHDTIEYANNMNLYYHLDKDLQFYYFLHIIRSRKRFAKWHKNTKDSDLNAVMQYYGYNITKAKAALGILTSKQIEHIRSVLSENT